MSVSALGTRCWWPHDGLTFTPHERYAKEVGSYRRPHVDTVEGMSSRGHAGGAAGQGSSPGEEPMSDKTCYACDAGLPSMAYQECRIAVPLRDELAGTTPSSQTCPNRATSSVLSQHLLSTRCGCAL